MTPRILVSNRVNGLLFPALSRLLSVPWEGVIVEFAVTGQADEYSVFHEFLRSREWERCGYVT